MQERLESATEALRVIVMFASKDVTEFPRIFFTNDVIALLCDEKPAIPPERYCTVLEKKEDLLWARIFARDYMNFLFEPHKPDRLRPLLDIKPTHQPKDRTISMDICQHHRKIHRFILRFLPQIHGIKTDSALSHCHRLIQCDLIICRFSVLPFQAHCMVLPLSHRRFRIRQFFLRPHCKMLR